MLPLYDLNPHRRTPVVVMAFVAANLGVFVFDLLQRHGGQHAAFTYTWSLVPERLWQIDDSQPWFAVLTSMFLHADWQHVLGNCWFLWLFGNNVEDRFKPTRFIVFYVLCGLAAAAAQVAVSPRSMVPMLGASGAISGVLGAYMRLFPFTPILTLVPFVVPVLPLPAIVFTLHWFAFQFWQGVGSLAATKTEGGIAWWAHIGGFVAGFVLARSMDGKRRK